MSQHLQRLALAASVSFLLEGPAAATEVIKTRLIDGYPSKAMWLQELRSFFIPEVDRRLATTGNYKIAWEEHFDGTLVPPKRVLDGLRDGVGDIGIVTTIFHYSQIPAQAIAAVTPFGAADAITVARAVDQIAHEFPTMRAEFEAQNQVYLATGVVLDTYQIYGKEPFAGLGDLEGARIAAAGMNLRYLEGIDGAVGVRGGLTDFARMLESGLVDFALLWPEAAETFGVTDVAPYMLEANLGAVNTKAISANRDYWNSLPAEVQNVLREVAVLYRDRLAALTMEEAQAARERFLEAGGETIALSTEARARWAEEMPNIAAEWVTRMENRGEPGTAMLEAYLNALDGAGFAPLRNWSLPARAGSYSSLH